ncbi:MAG: hypothetical protein HOH58_02020 [Opitutaceae bacterium]|jgi:hypothetical protein|nr:hypothetical protein [Opitutaceae bacterium]
MKIPFRYFWSFLLTFTASGALSAQTPRSPFMPAPLEQAEDVVEVVEDAELQFCGVFGDGDNKRFLIYNVTTNRSSWLRLNQEGPGEVSVEAFDRDQGTVNIRHGGRVLTLGMQSATISGSRAGGSAPVRLQNNSQDLVSTVKVNPTPTDERRRLEAVAAEVRRRRAARQAAAAKAPGAADAR